MNKTAMITGAASGLGFELARLLAADSYQLILVDRDDPGLERARSDLEKEFDVPVITRQSDLALPGAVDKIWDELKDNRFDVLVNNAGFGLYGFFSETPWEKEEEMLHLHIMTVTRLTKLVLGRMREQGSGRILNVSSLAAFQPGPLMSIYYASKAYILSFSEALANELQGTGITVTVLAPGWFRTNFQKTTARNSNVEESQARLHTATPEMVAIAAYQAMKRGKVLVIPGSANRLMSVAPRVLPRRTMTRIIRRIQEKLRE